MRKSLENALWKLRMNVLEILAKEEKGASDMIAILVIIVILIAVAAIFQDKLGEAIEAAFDTLITFVS